VSLRLVTTSAASGALPAPANATLQAASTAEPALIGRGVATAGLLFMLIAMGVGVVVLAARRTRVRPLSSSPPLASPLPESPLPAAPAVPETPLPAPLRITRSLPAPVPLAPPVPLPARSSRRPDRAAIWPRGADTPGIGPGSGDTLGQYQLLACVGQGGMGRVWAARRIGSPIQRLVALKTGLEAGNRSAEFRESFTDEARIASLIRHPNVCGVYEFGQEGDVLYQAMEWCDGASLRQVLDWLPEPRLELPVAARIIASVAAGLHAAHQLEDDDAVALHVVHRDVSPQNILISRQGQVQVTDFGVAKARGTFQRNGGDMRGKAAYMAPEQVTGDEVDQRTDIFALGCVLYEATVGRAPFQSEGGLSSTYQVLAHEVHPPSTLVPGYPAELASVVMKALARDPRDRFQSAEELGVALEGWLARAHGIVTEQTIAELMTSAAEPFIKEKARRVEQALARLAPPVPLAAMALLPSGAASVKAAVRTLPRTSEPPRIPRPRPREHVITGSRTPAEAAETAARPTIPAGRRRS
jgi:eukaryotic-like serine/threonine-protein kinase